VLQIFCYNLVVREREKIRIWALKFSGKAFYGLGNGGTEHSARNFFWQVAANALHIGVKSHTQHFVCLVHNQIANAPEIYVAPLSVV